MLHLLIALTAATLAQDPAPRIDPPPVNEAALAARLLDMTKPSRGERSCSTATSAVARCTRRR